MSEIEVNFRVEPRKLIGGGGLVLSFGPKAHIGEAYEITQLLRASLAKEGLVCKVFRVHNSTDSGEYIAGGFAKNNSDAFRDPSTTDSTMATIGRCIDESIAQYTQSNGINKSGVMPSASPSASPSTSTGEYEFFVENGDRGENLVIAGTGNNQLNNDTMQEVGGILDRLSIGHEPFGPIEGGSASVTVIPISRNSTATTTLMDALQNSLSKGSGRSGP